MSLSHAKSLSDINFIDPSTIFLIAKPTGRGKSFRLRYKDNSTEGKWLNLKIKEIEVANRLFQENVCNFEHTLEKFKKLKEDLYNKREIVKPKPQYTSHNFKIL